MLTEKEIAPLFTNYDFLQHVHDHSGKTSCDHEHAHLHPGVTGPPVPKECSHKHIHNLWGLTTFDYEHTHAYNAMTGPDIDLPEGMHTHWVQFDTNIVKGHKHRVMGFVVPSKM